MRVADHHQRRGEPAVVDAREEWTRGMILVPADAQSGRGLDLVKVEEEAMIPLHPAERGQGRPKPPVGLGVINQSERPGRIK